MFNLLPGKFLRDTVESVITFSFGHFKNLFVLSIILSNMRGMGSLVSSEIHVFL
jgi:hypothetical protein